MNPVILHVSAWFALIISSRTCPAPKTELPQERELQGARSAPGTSSVAGTQVAGTSLPSRAGTQPQTALRASFQRRSLSLMALLGILYLRPS